MARTPERVTLPPNYLTTPTQLTSEERYVGDKSFDLFFGKPGEKGALADAPNWSVTHNKVIVMERVPNTDPPLYRPRDISQGIARERLSPRATTILTTELVVEGQHPDYTAVAKERTRNYRGLSCYYDFWGLQEGTHAVVLAKVLADTQAKTPAELKALKEINDNNVWNEPYDTVLKMLCYARRQEFKTKLNYIRTANLLQREGAPVAARLLRGTAKQEGGHERGFGLFVGIYEELDPGLVRQAILEVEESFFMPVQGLIPNPTRSLTSFYRAGLYTPEVEAKDTYNYLIKTKLFTPEEAEKVAAKHLN